MYSPLEPGGRLPERGGRAVSGTNEPIRQHVDQLGERFVTQGPSGVVLTLRVAPALSEHQGFRTALAARCEALRPVEHARLARLLEAHEPEGDERCFSLGFELVRGERLSTLVRRRAEGRRPLSLGQVYHLVREAVAAVRALHGSGPGVLHGALSASRFALNAEGRLVLLDAVFGGALGALGWAPGRLRQELGVRVPELPGIPSFTPLTDQFQLGMLALHLATGSPVEEIPAASFAAACSAVRVPSAEGDAPLPEEFRTVLTRALLVSADGPYRSLMALDRALQAAVASDPANTPTAPEVTIEEWEPQVLAFVPPQVGGDEPVAACLVREGTTGEALSTLPAWWEPPVGSEPAPVQARTANPGEAMPEPPLHSERERPDLFDTAPLRAYRPEPPTGDSREPRVGALPASPPATPAQALVGGSPTASPVSDPQPSGAPAPLAPAPAPTPAPKISLAPAAPEQAARRSPARWEPEEGQFEVSPPADGYWRARESVFSEPEEAPRPWGRIVAILAVALAGVVAIGYYLLVGSAGKGPENGRLLLESKPAGATVVVEGVERGKTPLELTVPPGTYRVEFTLGEETKAVTVPVKEGSDAQQAVSLYPPGPPGVLEITSIPPGASVIVDGQARGKAPLRLTGIAPGERKVVVENAVGRAEQVVEVLAGAVAPATIPLSGVLEVQSPFEVMVFDKAKALGKVRSGRIQVPAGRRQITFASDELQFEENRDLDVPAGEVLRVALNPPTGMLNFTSDTPRETDVFLDDRPLGPTPLSNVPVSLGTHEVLFRHAKWGDQRYTILVTIGSPARLHAVMKAKQITVTRPKP